MPTLVHMHARGTNMYYTAQAVRGYILHAHQHTCLTSPIMMSTRPSLKNFDISPDTGFIPPKTPLSRLPPYFELWEEAVERLPQLLKEKRLRKVVHELPSLEFSENTLHSIEEWRRALVILSGLFQGYLWQEGETGVPPKMPAVLTVPLDAVSKHVGVPPVITYASCVLYNWGLRDPSQPMTADNLCALVTHTGTQDEAWFYIVALFVELEAAPAINAIMDIIAATADGNNLQVMHNLAIIESAFISMQHAINRMFEKCNPTVYYVHIRPFLSGSKGLDVFPEGLIYEGVDSKPMCFNGASGAQSTILPSIDALLGTQHKGTDADFLKDMHSYMPSKHRQFLEFITQQPSLRKYIMQSGHLQLVQQYNATVDAFVNYRSNHIILATRYIVMQRAHSVTSSLDEKGTGGTNFVQFLKNIRDNTRDLKILV